MTAHSGTVTEHNNIAQWHSNRAARAVGVQVVRGFDGLKQRRQQQIDMQAKQVPLQFAEAVRAVSGWFAEAIDQQHIVPCNTFDISGQCTRCV